MSDAKERFKPVAGYSFVYLLPDFPTEFTIMWEIYFTKSATEGIFFKFSLDNINLQIQVSLLMWEEMQNYVTFLFKHKAK